MSETSVIVFDPKNYGWGAGANAVEEMWKDVGRFLSILAKNEYLATVKQEESFAVVRYAHDNPEIAGTVNMWLSFEEADLVDDYRHDQKENGESNE